jgi:hypothetical protein
MPAMISHYLHALRALDVYREHSGTPVDRDAFLWGAQGPDFLFFQLPFPWRKTRGLRKLGLRIHRESPLPVLRAMRDYSVQNADDSIAHSYLLGFLCHYSLDRIVHPFVYAQIVALKSQYPRSKKPFLHCQIETSLDVVLLRYEREELPMEFSLKKTFPKNHGVQCRIAKIYSFLFQEVYGRAVAEKNVLQAERDCRFITGLQNDRTGLKKQLFRYFEKKHGKYLCSCVFRGVMEDENFDYANILSSPWSWPMDKTEKHTESFFDLYEKSIQESARFMLQIDQQADLNDLFGTTPFS